MDAFLGSLAQSYAVKKKLLEGYEQVLQIMHKEDSECSDYEAKAGFVHRFS